MYSTMLPAGSLEATASRLPAGFIPAHCTTSCNTQSSAPEDGRDQRPKHIELIGIINKLLLLHLVGVYIIYTCGNLKNLCNLLRKVRNN